MKRAFPVLIFLLSLLPVFSVSASGPAFQNTEVHVFRFGAGISVSGDSNALTGVQLNAVFRPFALNAANPFLRVETGFRAGSGNFAFSGLEVMAGVELFRSMKNPISFAMINKGPWSPALSAGMVTRTFSSVELVAEFSPFRVLDKDFIYEWFSVFGVFDGMHLDYWGVHLFRFTTMF